MNNRRLYRKLNDIEQRLERLDKQLDSKNQTNKVAVFLSFALALVAISVTYFVSGNTLSGLIIILFASFFLAYLIIQRVKSLKYVILSCLIVAFIGIVIYALAPLVNVFNKVGNIIFAIGILVVCVLYGLVLSKPNWFKNRHDK